MHTVTLILSILTALLFMYIMYLETFATISPATRRVFSLSPEAIESKEFIVLMKNQGVYNGVLGVLLLIGCFVFPNREWVLLLHGAIILVAAYGALTSNPSIILKQGGLSILAVLSGLILS